MVQRSILVIGGLTVQFSSFGQHPQRRDVAQDLWLKTFSSRFSDVVYDDASDVVAAAINEQIERAGKRWREDRQLKRSRSAHSRALATVVLYE